jgi:exonuclease SbcC
LARKSELDKAALGLESERRALETLAAQRTAAELKRDAEHAQLEQQRQALHEAEAELVRESEASAQLAQKQSALFDAQRKLGAANQRVQACRALSTSAQRLRQELDGIERKQALYEELRQAYGKNGVPAMIIESVLPELESSANALLGRMSAGRMTVRFETQRLTQKGDTNETLEIRINDEIGERAYEMFSGGEAFRINFAIRIALSRLLARRAGARLRTLFIDEGFGTQDAQGRERLVDAIRVIEDDFEKIFIITHIEELRDAFPARIEVTKTEKGSSARVV